MSDAVRVLVVADDLTGANDTGVQFAEAGWPSTLRTGRETPSRSAAGGATAVSTDCRALDHDAAAEATRAAVEREGLGPADHLYLKVDSTLRGSVPGQLVGALDVRRATRPEAFVLLCPAYPAMGRSVEDGVLRVHGDPVTHSPAGRDPVTPVVHDEVSELVPGAVRVRVGDSPDATADAWRTAARAADVLAVDARTDDELAQVAAVVVALGPDVVPAGSAGLAAPLATAWDTGRRSVTARARVRRPLVVVSSHHATARRQVAALVSARPDVTLVGTQVDELLERREVAAPRTGGPVVLVSPDERSEPGRSAELAAALGERAGAWLATGVFDAVLLVGGDGAESTLRAASAHGIAIRGRLLEGVPDGRLAGGPLDGLTVATKAGGFGDDATLVAALTTLLTPTTEDAR